MEEVPNLPMRKEDPPHVCFESGRRYGLWQVEKIIKSIYGVGSFEGKYLIRKDDLLDAIKKLDSPTKA